MYVGISSVSTSGENPQPLILPRLLPPKFPVAQKYTRSLKPAQALFFLSI